MSYVYSQQFRSIVWKDGEDEKHEESREVYKDGQHTTSKLLWHRVNPEMCFISSFQKYENGNLVEEIRDQEMTLEQFTPLMASHESSFHALE